MAFSAYSYRSQDKSSDSDSDNSDIDSKDWKRATRRTKDETPEKIPIIPPAVDPPVEILPAVEEKLVPPKRKRNNIWCEVLEDQMMSETLNHCGIKNKPLGYGSRGSESYDYTLSYKYFKRDEDSDKMSDEEMSDVSKSKSNQNRENRSFESKRYQNSKFVKLDGPDLKVAKKIVRTLGEKKQYLIFRVVKHLGIEKSLELLKKTEEIEDGGGMMIKNQQRRRTPGGVYFQLLKADKDIKKSAVDKIFEDELNSYEMKKKGEERKMQKKLKAEKKKLLKELSMMQDEQIESEEKVDLVMEDAETEPPAQTMPVSSNTIDSDVEEGEIND